jgi:hypothetical protein
MGADKSAENIPCAPKINLHKLSAQVQKFGILMKKMLHWASVVRGYVYLVEIFEKWVLINRPKIPQNAPKFICPNCLPNAKSLGFR